MPTALAMAWEPITIVASLWLAAGITVAGILYRRGHDGWHWMLVCAIAGPIAAVLVRDQPRLVEPDSPPLVVGATTAPPAGVTVVVPATAIGAVDGRMLDRLGLPVGRVAVAAAAPFEHIGTAAWDAVVHAALAEAEQRFAPHRVELVALPGSAADAIVGWAAEQAPAVILTTRGAHHPRSVGRISRLAAERRGVSTLVLDPSALDVVGTSPVAP